MPKLFYFLFFVTSLLLAQPNQLTLQSQQAKQLMAAGRFAEAIPIYQALVTALPGNPGLVLNLGMAQHLAGQDRAAVVNFEKALKIQPGLFPALAMGGTSYLRLGMPVQAIPLLQKALAIQPELKELKQTLADAYFLAGRPEEASDHLQRLARAYGENPKLWFTLSRTYEDLAKRSFTRLEQTGLGSEWWFALVAESRTRQNQRSSAFYFYRQALEKNPHMRGMHMAIAAIYRESGHPDWAATEERRENALSQADCRIPTAECLFLARRFPDIIAKLKKETSAEAHYWRTRAYNELAVESFAKLSAIGPSRHLHQFQAELYRDQGRYADAIEEFRRALWMQPQDRELERELAVTVYSSRDYAAAEPLLREQLQRTPLEAELHFLLGDALFQQQRVEPAIVSLEAAVARDARMLPARATLGRAYLQAGKVDKAIPHIAAALSIDDDGSLHYQLMRAYQTAGKQQEAGRILQKYREIQKANEAAKKELEREGEIKAP